jgi:HPt (histidine-containing phosphotransfer) domain-containing protein
MAATFDEVELMSRVDNDVAFLAETVDMIVADGPALLEQVRSAAAAGDAPVFARHAHSLKGMISNFCAPHAYACAFELEKLGKGGDLSGAGPVIERMNEQLSALTAELLGFVKART